jgi:GNAT superfamily N-acetyltransferase
MIEPAALGIRSRLRARPFDWDCDRDAVLGLINADRLIGQPACTIAMLEQAVAGRSPVDAAWWAELDPPAVDVLEHKRGECVGVVSYATRSRDGAGLLLWLHSCEQPEVVGALIDHGLAELGDRPVDAFDFATALSLGLEALPVRHRPATAVALRERGFVGRDLWRYMHRKLLAPDLPRLADYTIEDAGSGKLRLVVRDGDRVSAEAMVGTPVDGISVLWWIGVEPQYRQRGLGRALLGSALELLAELGAGEVILYVDDDDSGANPSGPRVPSSSCPPPGPGTGMATPRTSTTSGPPPSPPLACSAPTVAAAPPDCPRPSTSTTTTGASWPRS